MIGHWLDWHGSAIVLAAAPLLGQSGQWRWGLIALAIGAAPTYVRVHCWYC